MHFHIMTLFPDMITSALSESIIGRASDKGILDVEAVNIRDFAFNKHNKVDDYTYGGGAGMLMQAEPVYLCYENICDRIEGGTEKHACTADDNISVRKKTRVIYMTPQGEVFNQAKAKELAQEEDLIILCGHYEGVDERVLEEIVTDYISIGDYVLTGGELPAMILVDAISRFVPGVLHNDESAEYESFGDGLLEYPQYSRPEVWHDKKVPEVLMSGHHANVEKWRHEQSLERTRRIRPDLYEAYVANNPEEFAPPKKKRKKKKDYNNSDESMGEL